MKRFNKKYLLILVLIFIGGLVISFIIWFFNPQVKQAKQIKQGLDNLNKAIQIEEQKYATDTYGGITPEETYQKFLESLKKQDIDLACRYFLLEKQTECQQLLISIKNSNQWPFMMNDLTLPLNQKGKYLNENTYQIEIVNEKKEVVTSVMIIKPRNLLGIGDKPLTSLWKISSF